MSQNLKILVIKVSFLRRHMAWYIPELIVVFILPSFAYLFHILVAIILMS